jgi:hypothetical protein
MNFRPNFNGTLLMTANSASQNVALPNGGGGLLSIVNSGANIAYCELGSDANLPAQIPTANAGGGFPVFANQPALHVKLRATDTRLACISAGNSSVYFTRGDII